MYFSTEGRSELVATLDRMLLAKKMLTYKAKHFPDKGKFLVRYGTSDMDKFYFFLDALKTALDARIQFDPEQKPEEGAIDEIYKFNVYLDEIIEFQTLLEFTPNAKAWRTELELLIQKNLQEVKDDGFVDSEMNVELLENEKALQAGIECMSFCTYNHYLEAFMKFQNELNALLGELKKKRRLSA